MKIRRITSPLRVKGFKSIMHDIDEYILILMYIFIVRNDIKVLCRIYKEIHLVNNLKVYMLLNNDIISLKKIVLNVT